MIIPSIDLQSGHAVQLVRGEKKAIDAGDPRPIAERFGRVGEVAVIDLDAAMGTGLNAGVIDDLLSICRCRVGGGIRDEGTARRWLDRGAHKVILGTAAVPELLSRLPRSRVIAALDARDGEIVTHGWKTRTGVRVEDRLAELAPLVSGFLVTFVETEGTMSGLAADRAADLAAMLREIDPGCRLTVAGGVKEASEIGVLDALGLDAQIGMALYSGRFTLADALAACLNSDRADGLWPTVVCDEAGVALGLVYSNAASLAAALEEGRGVYHSRSRGGLWRKGETSGDTQELIAVDLDCDRDALRFTVRQHGPGGAPSGGAHGAFCHLRTRTCWGEGSGLRQLERRLAQPAQDPASYTARLLREPDLLASKLIEEARELIDAQTDAEVTHEAADVLYFTLARLRAAGVRLEAVERELDRRSLKLSRRPGDAKPDAEPATEPRAMPEDRPS